MTDKKGGVTFNEMEGSSRKPGDEQEYAMGEPMAADVTAIYDIPVQISAGDRLARWCSAIAGVLVTKIVGHQPVPPAMIANCHPRAAHTAINQPLQ